MRVLVTGGTSGIGLAAARLLAEPGTRIVLNGRDPARGEAARASIAGEAHLVAADVSRPEEAARLVAEAVAILGGLDVLVTAAGGDTVPTLFHDTDTAAIEAAARGWLLATIHVCHAALPHIADGGAVVTVASDAAKVPTPGESVIGAMMAGITMFSRTLAIEAKRRRVRVNCVTPSLVSGTATTARITAGGFSARLFERAAQAASLGVPDADDVAAVIGFLASPAAARVTGQVVSVNGGISAG